MAQPPPYVRQYDFSEFQASNPNTPLPGTQVDIELDEVKQTLDAVLDSLELIQRDDGALRNLSVGLDQLKPEVVLGVPTDWVTGTTYAAKAVVWQGGVLYVCNTAHTSGVFATDLAAAKWTAYLDYSDPLGDAAAYVADAQAAAAAAETAQTAAELAETNAEAAQALAEAAQAAAEAAIGAITLPWAVAQGGTGAVTPAAARTNLGAGAIGSAVFTAATASAARTALAISGEAANYRTDLGLGTAAIHNTGTSGSTVPLQNQNALFSGSQFWVSNSAADTQFIVGSSTNAFAAYANIYSAAGQFRAVRFYTGVNQRWLCGVNNAAESGSSAGSNFVLNAYDDSGTYLSQPILVTRSTGVVAFSATPNVAGSNVLTAATGAALATANIFTAFQTIQMTTPVLRFIDSGAAVDNRRWRFRINAGTFELSAMNDAESTINQALSITRSGATPSLATFGAEVVLPSAAATNNLSAGYRRLPVASIATGTPVAADSGKRIKATGGITIPASVFADGDVLVIDNTTASGITITQGAGMTMTWEGVGTTGNRTLAAYGRCIVTFGSASVSIINGTLT